VAADCIAELVAALAALSPEKRLATQQIDAASALNVGERVYVAPAPTVVQPSSIASHRIA